jgi:hypothetical protein
MNCSSILKIQTPPGKKFSPSKLCHSNLTAHTQKQSKSHGKVQTIHENNFFSFKCIGAFSGRSRSRVRKKSRTVMRNGAFRVRRFRGRTVFEPQFLQQLLFRLEFFLLQLQIEQMQLRKSQKTTCSNFVQNSK